MTFREPVPHRLASGLPELLAPAGSPEAFRAAVAAGADAVYLSGKRFGARRYAANFSDAEIRDAIRYAHAWGIRVYVTVNTLIHDRELKKALEYLGWLYSLGADAVLVQDTGLLTLARECLPGLTLHASTQMTIYNTPGVRWAASQGLSRVVLARELPLADVERIARETRDTAVGLEVFVHGALCYSYSGQCLLSSFLGGRSGNRGMCAQPCRKPYTLVTGDADAYGNPVNTREVPQKDRYLLSPKDLCTYYHLPALVRSPVASLKIEGRMKSPEYVAMVTSIYRKALDAIAAGTWEPSDEEYRNLLLAFNRGFTAGYLFSERYGKLMGRDAPDNRGLLVGRIGRYDRTTQTAQVRALQPVIPTTGDGILVTDPAHPDQEQGFSLNTLPTATKSSFTLPLPMPAPEGAEVYVTSSRNLAAAARRIVAKPLMELRRPLPLDLEVTISPDGEVSCTGAILRPDGVTLPVWAVPCGRMEPAQTRPLTAEQLRRQFCKTGDSSFSVRALSLRYEGGLFAPASVLNAMRRAFLTEAAVRLEASYLPDPDDVKTARGTIQKRLPDSPGGAAVTDPRVRDSPVRLMVIADTLEGVEHAADAGADMICYEPDFTITGRQTCGASEPESLRSRLLTARNYCHKNGADLIWKFPRIAHDKELGFLIGELVKVQDAGLAGCMAENPGISRAIHTAIPEMPILGAAGLNIFNHAAARISDPPYVLITVSPELSRDEIRDLVQKARRKNPGLRCAALVYGSIDMMVTEDCLARLIRSCGSRRTGTNDTATLPHLWLQDGNGRTYPVTTDGTCRTHIRSPSRIVLLDYLTELEDLGITDFIIDVRHQGTTGMHALFQAFRDGLYGQGKGAGATGAGGENRSIPQDQKPNGPGNFSPGHFRLGLRE